MRVLFSLALELIFVIAGHLIKTWAGAGGGGGFMAESFRLLTPFISVLEK